MVSTYRVFFEQGESVEVRAKSITEAREKAERERPGEKVTGITIEYLARTAARGKRQ